MEKIKVNYVPGYEIEAVYSEGPTAGCIEVSFPSFFGDMKVKWQIDDYIVKKEMKEMITDALNEVTFVAINSEHYSDLLEWCPEEEEFRKECRIGLDDVDSFVTCLTMEDIRKIVEYVTSHPNWEDGDGR